MQATTAITWFEIPAKDLERAVWFYESVLQQDLRRETMGPAAMAVFPYQEPGIGGALDARAEPHARCGRQRDLPAHAAGSTRLCSA